MTELPDRSLPWGQRDLQSWANRPCDVLLIGGGINGAGIARDLALRGLNVVLVERDDFGSGTSSASTKLVHGGLRYLENRDFSLVFESCRERRILQDIAPHLVGPLPFFIPVYAGDPRPLWMIRLGMWVYDLLALFRNNRHHQILSADKATRLEPALHREGLQGVARYWDCRMDDARLCLENVLAAREAGARVVNYCQAIALKKHRGRLGSALLRDTESGQEFELHARCIVNATGPWLDRVAALAGEKKSRLRPTRGTHIVVQRLNHGDEALYMTAGRDNRLFFVVPWGNFSLIGTTDTPDDSEPSQVTPSLDDIDYLLTEAARHLKLPRLGRSDIIAAFSGLRPLIAEDQEKAGKISREHRIFIDSSGLISVGGGKYTTYRSLAAEVSDTVCARLGRKNEPALTGKIPLPGGVTGRFDSFLRRTLPGLCKRLDLEDGQGEQLLRRYGSRINQLEPFLASRQDWAKPVVPGSSLLAGEIPFAVRLEFARTPWDILRRRTPLALEAGNGLNELSALAALMADELSASAEQMELWQNEYCQQLLTQNPCHDKESISC